MNHGHHGNGQGHPETFDEVIARGFPHEHLDALRKANETRVRGVTAPKWTRGAAAAAPVVARKDASSTFTTVEQTAFKNAIVRLVEEGKYQELVGHHMDMSHNMHGSMGEVGLYRFLGWHRRYLVEFERELQRVDKILRPTATEKLGVPYWRWQDPLSRSKLRLLTAAAQECLASKQSERCGYWHYSESVCHSGHGAFGGERLHEIYLRTRRVGASA